MVAAGPLAGVLVDGAEGAHVTSLSRRYSCSDRSRTLIDCRRSRSPFGPHTAVKSQKSQAVGSWTKTPRATRSTSRARRSRNSGLAGELGPEGHLPPAVHVVEEGVDHALAGEELRRGQHVERDLELLAAAEDAAVVPRGAARLVVAQHEAVGAPVDAVDLAGDAQRPAVAEVDLERLGVVRLLRVPLLAEAEAHLEVGGGRPLGDRRLAREPGLHASRGSGASRAARAG